MVHASKTEALVAVEPGEVQMHHEALEGAAFARCVVEAGELWSR